MIHLFVIIIIMTLIIIIIIIIVIIICSRRGSNLVGGRWIVFGCFWIVFGLFGIVFEPFLDRFGLSSSRFRTTLFLIQKFKFEISIGQGWGLSRADHRANPNRPAPALSTWNFCWNKNENENELNELIVRCVRGQTVVSGRKPRTTRLGWSAGLASWGSAVSMLFCNCWPRFRFLHSLGNKSVALANQCSKTIDQLMHWLMIDRSMTTTKTSFWQWQCRKIQKRCENRPIHPKTLWNALTIAWKHSKNALFKDWLNILLNINDNNKSCFLAVVYICLFFRRGQSLTFFFVGRRLLSCLRLENSFVVVYIR